MPVIEKQPVRSVYFGGGTPNFYEDLRNLQLSFDLLRHVKCDEKVIELHTSLPIADHAADGTQFLITVKNTGGGNDDIFIELLDPVDMKKYDASNAYEFK